MANSRFTLTSKSHEKNICSGLSNLQQNGEFVDMTLAADGHFVKVHQIIIALASPYIKELISSVQCQHPVIFLNKISHETLAAILEYIYTGEVLVTVESLRELVEAGKELHIKGLEDMHLDTALATKPGTGKDDNDKGKIITEQACKYLDTTNNAEDEETIEQNNTKDDSYINDMHGEEIQECQETFMDETMDDEDQQVNDNLQQMGISNIMVENISNNDAETNGFQYTVSNQGSLQIIFNRFMYYLKYTNRYKLRQWRCVDYLRNIRCPAHVITRDDVVIKRIAAHTHPFHDERILKKMRAGAIFTAIVEAEREGENAQRSRALNLTDELSD